MTINGTRSFSSTCAAGLVTFVTGQRPFQGAVETIILVLLLITVNLIIPCIVYSVGAFTAAYIIDYMFGAIMRKGFKCIDVPLNSTGSARQQFRHRKALQAGIRHQ
ncbi:hypothetical protein OS493_039549 [Desmophyllum pertusum]|uniref:Uncharacterized protein n=1 Tax=Desmophyllum pertusum TaxID=174260 RepID=A0A9W9ZVW9_9CNID|nr:hypothetical protein OS493_039549 [Desmophyllum pertusum]